MSGIEWTDETWNPVTGCRRVSAGCDNCYAVSMTRRLAKIGHSRHKYAGLVNAGAGHFNGQVRMHEDELGKPLHWRKARRIFVNSMSDLFHEGVPFEFLDRVFAVMALCFQHTFQVLTKRPARMAEYAASTGRLGAITPRMNELCSMSCVHSTQTESWPLSNVLLGVSIENRTAAIERLPLLFDLKKRGWRTFVSYEPALGPVEWECCLCSARGEKSQPAFDWLIAGGESGPKARPSDPYWYRMARDFCQRWEVPFFFKQWGAWKPVASVQRKGDTIMAEADGFGDVETTGSVMRWAGKKAAGRVLDGRTWDEHP